MFIGRKRELAALQTQYDSGKFEFTVIYGHRRVGKTAIINEDYNASLTDFVMTDVICCQSNQCFSGLVSSVHVSGLLSSGISPDKICS